MKKKGISLMCVEKILLT